MREKLERIWNVVKNLRTKGKIGVFLWLIGYPIGFAGIFLMATGYHQIGFILFLIPFFEGNLGMVLMGKEVILSIREEFFRK